MGNELLTEELTDVLLQSQSTPPLLSLFSFPLPSPTLSPLFLFNLHLLPRLLLFSPFSSPPLPSFPLL